jgi:glycosyltransferase involved in cell wall biosynthesis/UDP-N-acetylglucosamine transferase subunit ALG13
MKILLIASSGGHFLQLYKIQTLWNEHECVWITFNKEDTTYFLSRSKERTIWAFNPTNRNVLNFIRNLILAYKVIQTECPDLIVSTGAGIAVPFLLLGRMLKVTTIYIESFTRTRHLSLSGKIVFRFVDYFVVQWKILKDAIPKTLYLGKVIDINHRCIDRNGPFQENHHIDNKLELRSPHNKKIFVTAGLEKYQFNRLFLCVDSLIERGLVDPQSLICQKGKSSYVPKRYSAFDYISFEDMITNIVKADIVISHAGIGTLILCLDLGKIPIIFPRQSQHKEHLDNHQTEFCKDIGTFRKALIAYDETHLAEAISKYDELCNIVMHSSIAPDMDLTDNIRKIINFPKKSPIGSMRVALIGTRGVPATHGGFETCVEEIGKRFASYGHSVFVYSKRPAPKRKLKQFEGMQVIYIPRIPIKGFETLFAAMVSVVHSLHNKYDFHMVFDPANSPTLLIYKLFGKHCAINVDGLGWQRDKWGYFAKRYYKWSEWFAVKVCQNIVTDSKAMARYYKDEYGASTATIAYGANIPEQADPQKEEEILSSFGLKRNEYFLQITRFEPENNPLLTLQAFNSIATKLSMVLIGGVLKKTKYSESIQLEASKNKAILLPGFIYDNSTLNIFWTNASCYIHGNHIGGTNPALLQAMAAGRPVIARDCVFNREVLEEFGYYYERNISSLCGNMQYVQKNKQEVEGKALKALGKVKSVFTWDKIADQYLTLFKTIIEKE